jgi:hypothetical protein
MWSHGDLSEIAIWKAGCSEGVLRWVKLTPNQVQRVWLGKATARRNVRDRKNEQRYIQNLSLFADRNMRESLLRAGPSSAIAYVVERTNHCLPHALASASNDWIHFLTPCSYTNNSAAPCIDITFSSSWICAIGNANQ